MKYQSRHDNIWPELVEVLHDAGMRNYTLFRHRLEVIGYAECHPDVHTVRGRLEATDVNKRWQLSFADILSTSSDGEWKVEYQEVWHID